MCFIMCLRCTRTERNTHRFRPYIWCTFKVHPKCILPLLLQLISNYIGRNWFQMLLYIGGWERVHLIISFYVFRPKQLIQQPQLQDNFRALQQQVGFLHETKFSLVFCFRALSMWLVSLSTFLNSSALWEFLWPLLHRTRCLVEFG